MGASVSTAECLDMEYNVKKKGYRVWLIGDSILDNAFWNGVNENTTGVCLSRTLTSKVKVCDRSTEELDGLSLLNCLRRGSTIQVRNQYVRHRRNCGIPYPNRGEKTKNISKSKVILRFHQSKF